MNKITAAITAVEGAVPDYVLTNKELETMVDTTDEWIITRTGIQERRILKDKNQASSYLGTIAVKKLLEKRGISPKEVDALICATITPDMMFPSTGNLISYNAGMDNVFSFDISAACSGFIYALEIATKFVESGKYKKVVVVGVDKMSSIIDYTDRATCILFGDAAGAVLVEPNTEGLGILDSFLKSDGSGSEFLHMKAGGSLRPASHETVDAREHFLYQEGQSVFKFAVTNMADSAIEILKRNNLTADDINWLIAHQANKRIIDATARRAEIDPEKVVINVNKYGNTTAATIPLCLWEWEKQFRKGDKIILVAFGGGFTWGATYLKWAYDLK